MRKQTILALPILIAAIILSGCSDRKNISPVPSIKEEVKQEIKSPINCKTAKSDIRLLEKEEASVLKRMISGVRSVMPIAAAAGILTGDYSDRVKVATGKYNADLAAKIQEIKTTCGIE